MADRLEDKVHPLEGKYVVFIYNECDHEGEGSALAAYKISDGDLQAIFSPSAFLEPCQLGHESAVYDEETGKYISANDACINKLKRLGVQEVYSVFRSKDFFGIPYSSQCLSDVLNEEGDIECWNEWDSICKDTEEYDFLTQNGIKVRFYHDDKKEIFE